MSEYNYEKQCRLARLKLEIVASGLAEPSHLNQVGSSLCVGYSTPLTVEQEATLSSVIAAHSYTTALDQVTPILNNAAEYGLGIIRDFGIRNMLAGKTDVQIDSILENSDVLKIGMALISGSLKYARRKVSALTPFDGVNQSDKDWMYDKLTEFLGPE